MNKGIFVQMLPWLALKDEQNLDWQVSVQKLFRQKEHPTTTDWAQNVPFKYKKKMNILLLQESTVLFEKYWQLRPGRYLGARLRGCNVAVCRANFIQSLEVSVSWGCAQQWHAEFTVLGINTIWLYYSRHRTKVTSFWEWWGKRQRLS